MNLKSRRDALKAAGVVAASAVISSCSSKIKTSSDILKVKSSEIDDGFVYCFLNDDSIGVSDYCQVSVSRDRIRFTRPVSDGQGYEYSSPGSRIRFCTDASNVKIKLLYTDLILRKNPYSGIGVILVDGEIYSEFGISTATRGEVLIGLNFSESAGRLIEVVMPICASVDAKFVAVNKASKVWKAPERPSVRYVAAGDSITHGFSTSNISESWPYLLAKQKNWQLINHGYGSRRAESADGTSVAMLNPDIVTYLIGFNNYYPQMSVSGFKDSYVGFLRNFRSINKKAKIYCITPTWTSAEYGSLGIELYRAAIRSALTDFGDPMSILVEGESLSNGGIDKFPDRVHPNRLGAVDIFSALSKVVMV